MIDLVKLASIVEKSEVSLTEEDILSFLKIRHRWPFKYSCGLPSVEIFCNNENLVSTSIFDIDSYFNYNKWKHFYDLGFTTIISNTLDLTEELRELNKKLTDNTGLPIWCNFYFSKPGQIPSFSYHKHHYDVIVKQIYGSAKWRVGDEFFTLKPNQVCIIPKDVKHQVLTKDEKKLSMTLNIQ